MSDERRAEIEAVARAVSRKLNSWLYAVGLDTAERVDIASYEIAEAALDAVRVREARGDDEGIVWALRRAVAALGAAAVAFRKLDEGTGYPPHIAAGDAKRAEDHAREALRRYDRERDAGRDGTVAVEDVERLVEALRPFVDAYDAVGRTFCPEFNGPEALAHFDRAAEVLAELRP